MTNLLLLALGGAIGTLCRYFFYSLQISNTGFQFSTLFVNLVGSFLIGLFAVIFINLNTPNSIRLFLTIGVLGGFTTFSSFSLENMFLLQNGKYLLALTNVLISTIFGILLAFLGFWLGKLFF
ncbi:MAG: CrcB family protein [Candidatus Margulisbacteria bacterium]|nr:CrcB family protein [Candidatus Margulisiibacteriota bacterium]